MQQGAKILQQGYGYLRGQRSEKGLNCGIRGRQLGASQTGCSEGAGASGSPTGRTYGDILVGRTTLAIGNPSYLLLFNKAFFKAIDIWCERANSYTFTRQGKCK